MGPLEIAAELRATHCSNENLHDHAADIIDSLYANLQQANSDLQRHILLANEAAGLIGDQCEMMEEERDSARAECEKLRKELTMARWTIEDGLRTSMTRSLTEWNEYVRRANSAIIHINAALEGK